MLLLPPPPATPPQPADNEEETRGGVDSACPTFVFLQLFKVVSGTRAVPGISAGGLVRGNEPL